MFVKGGGGSRRWPYTPLLLFPSHLPHQPVIHPVCELNECNEACYPYLYTQTHTPSHTNIPWQTKLPLPPPILPLHLLPSGVLFVYLGVCVCVYFLHLGVRLCVVEHAFLLSPENNRQGRMVEWGCVRLPCLSSLCVCMLAWSSVTCGCVYVRLFVRQANSGKSVWAGRLAWGMRLKDCFVFCFHSWGQDEGWIERKREGRGSGEGEWVSQLGEIKVGLTFSTPSTPAESPPVPSHLLLSSSLPPSSFPPHGESVSLDSRGYCLRRQ